MSLSQKRQLEKTSAIQKTWKKKHAALEREYVKRKAALEKEFEGKRNSLDTAKQSEQTKTLKKFGCLSCDTKKKKDLESCYSCGVQLCSDCFDGSCKGTKENQGLWRRCTDGCEKLICPNCESFECALGEDCGAIYCADCEDFDKCEVCDEGLCSDRCCMYAHRKYCRHERYY